MTDSTRCPGCGVLYSEPHKPHCTVVADARHARAELRAREAARRLSDPTVDERICDLGLAPPFKVKQLKQLDEFVTTWVVEDQASVMICTCNVEKHAKLIVDALNWLQDDWLHG